MEKDTFYNGRIVNLDEDQIQIELLTTPPENIYIDFAYAGIPEELNIKEIQIIDTPQEKYSKKTTDEEEQIETTIENIESIMNEDEPLIYDDDFDTNVEIDIVNIDKTKKNIC